MIQAQKVKEKMERYAMAKYNKDLFDKLIVEMQDQGRSMLEICAELDCEENHVYEAQERIQQRKYKEEFNKTEQSA